MAQPIEERLVRGIGRWDLVAVAINGIIGAGIFGLPSKVFALIGPCERDRISSPARS